MNKGTILGTIVGAALLTVAPLSLQWSQKTVMLSLDRADARIGRPLTPLSVAGVHRRAYRRAAYGTAAAYGVGSYYGVSDHSGYSDGSYGYPASGYGSFYASAGYSGHSNYGYPASGYEPYASAGYPGYSYASYGQSQRSANQSALYDVMPGYDESGITVWIPNPDRFGIQSQH
jgi:hypothetical protein